MQPPRQSTPWCFFLLSILGCSMVLGYKHNYNSHRPSAVAGARRRRPLAPLLLHQSTCHPSLFCRGGAMLRDDMEDEEESEYDDEDEEEEEEEEEESEEEEDSEQETTPQPSSPSSSSGPPVSITIRLSTGSQLLDDSLELPTVGRHRTVAFVKQSVSRRFSGKPPMGCIQLIHDGLVLDDDTLIDELLADDEDDDEEEEGSDKSNDDDDSSDKSLTLFLDIVPTVDPKTFLVELDTKLADATTLEILEAFLLNEAAVYENYAGIMQGPSDDSTSSRVLSKLKERAAELRKRLDASQLNTDNARSLLANQLSPNQQRVASVNAIETKGERVRQVGSTSPRHVRRSMQQYLNVDWGTLIKHTLLFVFFGYFGGHNAMARTLLYLGAPALVIVQTRPVKFLIKQVVYALLYRPPGIVLSLLPAPQQAIVSLNMKKSMQQIYGDGHIVRNMPQEEEPVDEFVDAMQFDDVDDEEEEMSEEGEVGMEEEDYEEYDEEEESSLDDDEYDLE